MKKFKSIISLAMMFIILIAQIFAMKVEAAVDTVAPQPSAPVKKAIPALAKPDLAKALKVAEKYYNLGVSKASVYEKQYIPVMINWKPDFKGKSKNPIKASQYLTSAAYLTAYTDLKGIYLPMNAALFTLDPANSTIAGNLASSIAAYAEDTTKKNIGEVLSKSKEIQGYAEDASAVYEYALACELANSKIQLSALPLLLNYGYICIDRGKLDSAKVVLESAYKLAPGYMPAAEGMASYFLAKGDRAKAKSVLESANLSVMGKNIKKMRENISEEKVPQVYPTDSHESAQIKLKKLNNVQTVLATDFYEEIKPEEAQAARRFVSNLQSSIRYTAPSYNYLSQYSTLKSYCSNGGLSAYEEFVSELWAFDEKIESQQISEAELNAIEQAMDQIESDPNTDPEHLAALYAKMNEKFMIQPHLLVLAMNPYDYVNPTDIFAQQYNAIELSRKKGSYITYLTKQIADVAEVLEPISEDLENKLIPIEESMHEELEELFREHQTSHENQGECGACITKTHEIHAKYDPRLNQLVETTWMDATNFVSMRYTQRIKPNIEAMYVESMKNVLLISDPAVRAKVEEELKDDIDALTSIALHNVDLAYKIDLRGYPYECDCNYTKIQAIVERQKKEQAAAEAQRMTMQMKARQDFLAGEISESSQLYQKLDRYASSCQLMFMKMKMHPLKTEAAMEVNIPGTDTSATAKIVQNHIRNTTTYSGGMTVTVGSADTAGGSIGATASVSLQGEVSVDGKGNIVNADITGAAQGSVSAFGTEASATYEASVQRGCKLSGEVAKIYNNEVIKLPEELEAFKPDKAEKTKKVLWQGEYQISK